jgi:hypothetical protein
VGLGTGLDGFRKSRPPMGFEPRTVQRVACRCTDGTANATAGGTYRDRVEACRIKVQLLHDAVYFDKHTYGGRTVCFDLQIALKKEQ